jgi:hypothetical protein
MILHVYLHDVQNGFRLLKRVERQVVVCPRDGVCRVEENSVQSVVQVLCASLEFLYSNTSMFGIESVGSPAST